LESAGRLIRWRKMNSEEDLVRAIDRLVPPDVQVLPRTPDLRVRHVMKHGVHCYMLFNEGEDEVNADFAFSKPGKQHLLDAETGGISRIDENEPMSIPAHAMRVVMILDA